VALAVVVPALLVGACGGSQPIVDEELTAEPYPREAETGPQDDDLTPTLEDWARHARSEEDDDHGVEEAVPPPAADAEEPDADEPDADGGPDDAGPRPSDAAEYLAERLPGDALDRDVLLVEQPEGEPKLVLAMVTADGEALVETARWSGDAFEHIDRSEAGPASALGTLRTPSLHTERLIGLGLHHEGELRIGVWRLVEGALEIPDDCPLGEPREIHGQRSAPVEVVCDAEEGSPQALVWHEGVFEPRGETARTERPDRADERGREGRSDGTSGRSDARDGPRGTQGRGPRGR
jgi:hypothetical protein